MYLELSQSGFGRNWFFEARHHAVKTQLCFDPFKHWKFLNCTAYFRQLVTFFLFGFIVVHAIAQFKARTECHFMQRVPAGMP